MQAYHNNIEELTVANQDFRQVLFTGHHSQLVLMSLKPGEEIGLETHPDNDQFFRFEAGEGKVVVDGQEFVVKDGDAVVIKSGSKHNVINTSQSQALKMYTIYSPAHHPDGTVHHTKKEALAAEEEHHS
ncbi:MAG: cupin domain-containing protein [Candidatus Pacebacteria bacterium]|nr:cupin domain-containing protein [Candidatus Paceibacterota bacterium]